MNKQVKISIVVPVYNEERNIKKFLERTVLSFKNIIVDYEILFVLDPSTDSTFDIIVD